MINNLHPRLLLATPSALTRNVELGRNFKITGTPTLIFVNGNRVPGAVDAKQVEKLLTDAKG